MGCAPEEAAEFIAEQEAVTPESIQAAQDEKNSLLETVAELRERIDYLEVRLREPQASVSEERILTVQMNEENFRYQIHADYLKEQIQHERTIR